MTRRHKGHLGIRLAVLSPVAALLVLAFVVVSIPYGLQLGVALFTSGSQGVALGAVESDVEMIAAADRLMTISRDAALSSGGDPETSEGMFDTAGQETWRLVNAERDALIVDGAVVSMPFADDSEVFEPIAAWERTNDARVWAWTVLAPEQPPLVAVANVRGKALEAWAIEPPAEGGETSSAVSASSEGSETEADRLWQELHFDPSPLPALDSSVFYAGTGSGTGSETESRVTGTIVQSGKAWRCICVKTISSVEEWVQVPAELLEKDPRDADYEAWLETVARDNEMDIWVFGPLESKSVPLRAPAGATEEDLATLGEAVWPELLLADSEVARYVSAPLPQELSPELAELAGGPIGAIALADYYHAVNYAYPIGAKAPQTIAYLVVLDDVAGLQQGPIARAWDRWRSVAAGNVRLLFGAAFALLGISLVACPTALVIDRKRRARERAAEERERMRRDAHDKVYNRLSALSKRVAQVSEGAMNGTAGSLASIAEDIRGAVGELQEILGDDVAHTSSALTSISLEDQLAAVCGAQAARLGVEVTCDVARSVPPVSAGVGWDLQCITEEAITNAVRHGGATNVSVTVGQVRAGELRLMVADDGDGSPVLAADDAPEGSTGLRGMRDRAASHDGTLRLDSAETGTTLTVTLRVGEAAGDAET